MPNAGADLPNKSWAKRRAQPGYTLAAMLHAQKACCTACAKIDQLACKSWGPEQACQACPIEPDPELLDNRMELVHCFPFERFSKDGCDNGNHKNSAA